MTPYVLLAFANFFWSLNFIIGKLVVGVIPPITICFLRWSIPLVFYLIYAWNDFWRNRHVYRKHWLLILCLGLTGYCVNSFAVYEAVIYTSTINTSFINAFNPVVIALTGFIMYRYSVSPRQAGGFFLALVGVVWIIFKGDPGLILNLHINIGDLFMVGSVVTWSIHTILYKRHAHLFPARSLFTVMMLAGVVMTIPLVLAENLVQGNKWLAQIRLEHILGIICLNIFPSVLAYRFWNKALENISANKVAVSQYLIPVFTVIISLLFLGERLEQYQMIGGALIFAGLLLVTNILARNEGR
jgi:drug/metabolite transporter (DMT)-like permease